jgi:uncharacterized protein (TIGR00375 family)
MTSSKNNDIRERIVDLHIHSHHSRATSKHLNIEELYTWGKIKGINVMGTGDFTHPAWFEELFKKLEPAEPGLYKLKDEFAEKQDVHIPPSCKNNEIRFVLTVEISNIYTRGGIGRRLHNIVIVPDFETASAINAQLARIGNIKSDGRPILGLDSEKLLEITRTINPDSLFIPAHIWTPWFAMFGSKSGFDSIEEAFGNNSEYIYAIETGLSSDPFMNWRLSQLDKVTLVSNSDAHSPQKLAREANIIKSKLDYFDIVDAIKKNDERFIGTIEFFPEEGKYHYDGHRLCNVRMKPAETRKHKGICPVCHKPLVVGVENRVEELADRPEGYTPKNHKSVEYIVPLIEIVAEIKGVSGTGSKTVLTEYEKIISTFGDEFTILRHTTPAEIKQKGFPALSHAIHKLRNKDIVIEPGYDGVFGVVKIFNESD